MALATRPKPNTYHRKRRAEHHRHSKTYVRAYWPYLPMLIIVGAGALLNKAWPASSTLTHASANGQLSAIGPVTRIQALTGEQTGQVLLVVIVVATIAFAVFLLRHSYRLHRLIHKGEAFVSNHPWFDIATVFVFTAGFVLTRVNGLSA